MNVLLLGFRRADAIDSHLRRLIRLGFRHVFISLDSPRTNNAADEDGHKATLQVIAEFRDRISIFLQVLPTNQGPGRGVFLGVTWFFEQVESGIILEDDCQPCDTFFALMPMALDLLRQNANVAFFSGCRLGGSNTLSSKGFLYTRLPVTWGWATLRDRWQGFDRTFGNTCSWRRGVLARRSGFTYMQCISLVLQFKLADQRKIDAWDLQWCVYNWTLGRTSLVPPDNLINYIGVDKAATHTSAQARFMAIRCSHELVADRTAAIDPQGVDRTFDRNAANFVHDAESVVKTCRMLLSIFLPRSLFFFFRRVVR